MSIELVLAKAEYAAQFRECLEAVAKEGRYLIFTEAPPVASLAEDLRTLTKTGAPGVFAFDGPRLIGWCDLRLTQSDSERHRAELGMGVLRDYRGQGIGRSLLERIIQAASELGVEKLELLVLADNTPALGLYGSVGFKEEGRILSYRKLNGRYTDAIHMGLFLG